jgi:hypothetical protein
MLIAIVSTDEHHLKGKNTFDNNNSKIRREMRMVGHYVASVDRFGKHCLVADSLENSRSLPIPFTQLAYYYYYYASSQLS